MFNTRNPYWLREALDQTGLPIGELARRAKINRSQITRLLPNETTGVPACLPQVRTLHRIEDVLRPLLEGAGA